MSKKLDRDRYAAIVYGDPIEKYMQDGMFFTGTGEFVRMAEGSAAPTKAELKPESMVAKQDKPVGNQLEMLQSMHISKLRPLAGKVEAATGAKKPKMTGKGLKARLVAYIAKNTKE